MKEVLKLTSHLAVLSRFMSQVGDKAHPFFQCLKKSKDFNWTAECEEVFLKIKELLATPPVLAQPKDGETLFLYISASDIVVSAALVTEEANNQQPVYFRVNILCSCEMDSMVKSLHPSVCNFKFYSCFQPNVPRLPKSMICLLKSYQPKRMINLGACSRNPNAITPISWISSEDLEKLFESWMLKYGKIYNSNEEKLRKFSNFKDIYKFIDERKDKVQYCLELNQFADWSNQEYGHILGYNFFGELTYAFNADEFSIEKNMVYSNDDDIYI